MSPGSSEALRRSLLLGVRTRFSPPGAGIRQQAIERIIEQNLASVEGDTDLTEDQLRHLVTLGGRVPVLRPADVRQGIDALVQCGRITRVVAGRRSRYRLSDDARNAVKQTITQAEDRTMSTVRDLFGKGPGEQEAYERAFLRLLCTVFSRLSEVYLRVITGREGDAALAKHEMLAAAVEEALQSEGVPDAEAFRYGVHRFFRESSPQFDEIKWNMAQNFYVVKALGIDSSSSVLSAELFRGASLYCDTNVLIAGLTPQNRHYNSFQALSGACAEIGMSLRATHVTLDELRRVIRDHAARLRAVMDKIPDQTLPKVSDFLLDAYRAEQETSPELSLDAFVERLQTPLRTLRDSFGLVVEDDRWFDRAAEEGDTKKLAENLSGLHAQMRRRAKSKNVALHDALLLRWVARENAAGRNVWLVTLDLTVVESNRQRGLEGTKVVTLDAFLQWMSPIMSGSVDEARFADIFAEAVRYQLLPKDTFFQLRDFQVFADMEIETKHLPAEDVEACIREIKETCGGLDPSKAEDQLKLAHVVQRYFADPGTKFRRRMAELEDRDANLMRDLTRAQECIARLEADVADRERRDQHRQLVNSAIWRSVLAFAILVVVEGVIGYLAWRFGEGQNLFQKLTNAWPWLTGGAAVVAVSYPFLMGRERIRLLKWWKGESDRSGQESS